MKIISELIWVAAYPPDVLTAYTNGGGFANSQEAQWGHAANFKPEESISYADGTFSKGGELPSGNKFAIWGKADCKC